MSYILKNVAVSPIKGAKNLTISSGYVQRKLNGKTSFHKALDIDRLWQSHHHSIEYLIPDFLLYITEYPARHPLTASQNIIENREYLR